MNFLAHLWLADRSATSMAGAVLGDVVRGADLSAYPPEIAAGIRLHRRIDAATDRHPQVVAARAGFAPGQRRYAGIVLDLVCDHLLARDWREHAGEPLPAFCQRAAGEVAAAGAWFAQAGARSPEADAFARLLQSYAAPEGIDHAVRRVARRLRQPQALVDAAADWPTLAASFRAALPALLRDLAALTP